MIPGRNAEPQMAEAPRASRFLQRLVLPVLLAAYPVIFLYQVNSKILAPRSLLLPLAACVGVAVLAYGLFFSANGRRALEASHAAIGFLLSFLLYGSAYSLLLKADIVPIDHPRFLPLMVLVGLYAGCLLARLPAHAARWLHQAALVILGSLIVYNLAGIAVVEYRKATSTTGLPEPAAVPTQAQAARATPDIYYIVLDEFAGFDVIREYWHYDEIDRFEEFLTDKGFYVATASRSRTASTSFEMAARLNFEYPEDAQDRVYYSGLIAHNRVMEYLSGLGYTTVVFDGTGGSFAFPGKPPIEADFAFEYQPGAEDAAGLSVDEFAKMVFDRTMLRVATDASASLYAPMLELYRNNILYTFDKVPDLDEVPSPRFVYAHIMLPHIPFVFDENGNPTDTKYLYNWENYFGSYVFAIEKAQELVDGLLADIDPANPPILILQSDHGPRNMLTEEPDSAVLPDFPEEFKKHILNAMFLPGVDYSQFRPDFAPINTFPFIFNTYFGTDFPLQ